MSTSSYLGGRARLRLLELGGRSPSHQDLMDYDAENLRKRLLSGPLIHVFVGPERRQWSLHHNLLCHHSSYFENDVKDRGATGDGASEFGKIDLPHDSPVGFELLVKWLYQGQLEDTSQFSDEAKYDYAVACHKLFLLCDKFDMVKLKNIAIDQYRQCLNDCQLVPDAEEINDIYRASPVDSPFRSLMIRIAARQIMDPDNSRDAEAYRKCFQDNPDFAVEMVNAIRHMSRGILFEDPTSGDHCSYHDHTDSAGCPLQGTGKGKARSQTKHGAMNGQGSPPPASDTEELSAYAAIPPTSQLSSERNPQDLKTLARSPGANAGHLHPLDHVRRLTLGPVANQSARRLSHEEVEALARDRPSPQRALRSRPRKLERRSGPSNQPREDEDFSSLRFSLPKEDEVVHGGSLPIATTQLRQSTRRGAANNTAPIDQAERSARKRKLADRTLQTRARPGNITVSSMLDQHFTPHSSNGRSAFDQSGASKPSSERSGPRKSSRVGSVARHLDGMGGPRQLILGVKLQAVRLTTV